MCSFEIAHSSVQGILLMGFVPEHLRLYLKCFASFLFACLFYIYVMTAIWTGLPADNW